MMPLNLWIRIAHDIAEMAKLLEMRPPMEIDRIRDETIAKLRANAERIAAEHGTTIAALGSFERLE